MKNQNNKLCPCNSGLFYPVCCQVYHQGTLPPDALRLMRSRYSAYALGLVNYIIETTHPQYYPTIKKQEWVQHIQDFIQHTIFERLVILESQLGPEKSYVTFVAYLRQGNHETTFTEKSLFQKWQGRWVYCKGQLAQGSLSLQEAKKFFEKEF